MVSEASLNPSPGIGILTGPTASGKTGIALRLASRFGKIEIVNADSLLVYRTMNIGTAKPTSEELKEVPHHLIDIRNPDETFTAGEFLRAANQSIQEIHQRGNRALIVGGTGFYLKALLFGLWQAPAADADFRSLMNLKSKEELYQELEKIDSPSALRIGMNDRYRLIRALELFHLTGKTPTELQAQQPTTPDPRFQIWIIDRATSNLHQRIHLRTQQMLQDGLVDEYQRVYKQFPNSRALQSIGYAQVQAYLSGQAPEGRKVKPGLEGLSEEIQLATRQLVKQQRTWFRGQLSALPTTHWFQLEEEILRLEEAFHSVYQ